MATAQVEAGDLRFTVIRNIPCAAVAIQLWTNGDARGGVAPLEREEGRERMPLHVFFHDERCSQHLFINA